MQIMSNFGLVFPFIINNFELNVQCTWTNAPFTTNWCFNIQSVFDWSIEWSISVISRVAIWSLPISLHNQYPLVKFIEHFPKFHFRNCLHLLVHQLYSTNVKHTPAIFNRKIKQNILIHSKSSRIIVDWISGYDLINFKSKHIICFDTNIHVILFAF